MMTSVYSVFVLQLKPINGSEIEEPVGGQQQEVVVKTKLAAASAAGPSSSTAAAAAATGEHLQMRPCYISGTVSGQAGSGSLQLQQLRRDIEQGGTTALL